MSYADWMSNLPEKLRQCPLSQIAIPGTHDSATCGISQKSPAGPDLENCLKTFNRVFCNLPKKFIVNWSVTQTLSLTDQMKSGIRYFDLRLAFDATTNAFYATHGLLSTSLQQLLTEIASFVRTHVGEVLLVDFNHFYAMNLEQHMMASQLILQYLADELFPMPSKFRVPSINDCMQCNQRILVFYHEDVCDLNLPFWNGSCIPSPWPNTDSVSELIDILDDNYNQMRPSFLFYVTQGVLTPDTSFILKNLSKSLQTISKRTNASVIEWVRKKTIGKGGINICIIDFCQDSDYIPTILELNK